MIFENQRGMKYIEHSRPWRFGVFKLCPITNQEKGYPFEVKLTAEDKLTGVILSDQIKTLDWKARRCEVAGQAPISVTQEVLDKIHTFLGRI